MKALRIGSSLGGLSVSKQRVHHTSSTQELLLTYGIQLLCWHTDGRTEGDISKQTTF